jgi:hypothetical protein
MYQLFYKFGATELADRVIRLSDNAFIPFDQQNTDYVAYLAWLAEGNEPLSPDEPTQE